MKHSGGGPTRSPDVTGAAARAWMVKLAPSTPDQTATLAGWIVNAPSAHPMWSWWMVSLIHLRPIEGVKPAWKKYAEAEFEFSILALDPREPAPDPDHSEKGYPFMTPVDVLEQFHGVSDADAVRICRSAITAITSGLLSPDQDFRPAWRNSIAATVEHFRSGAHVEH